MLRLFQNVHLKLDQILKELGEIRMDLTAIKKAAADVATQTGNIATDLAALNTRVNGLTASSPEDQAEIDSIAAALSANATALAAAGDGLNAIAAAPAPPPTAGTPPTG